MFHMGNFAMLVYVVLAIYLLILATRFDKAVEKIADKFDSEPS